MPAPQPFRPGDYPPPDVDARLRILQERMAAAGYPVQVVPKTGRWRSAKDQAALYAKGRTVMGSGRATPDRPFGGTVTEKSGAPGQESLHQLGQAADFMFTGGRENWQLLGQEAKALGLEWGGDWKNPYDPGHVQQVARGVLNASRVVPAGTQAGGHTDPASARVLGPEPDRGVHAEVPPPPAPPGVRTQLPASMDPTAGTIQRGDINLPVDVAPPVPPRSMALPADSLTTTTPADIDDAARRMPVARPPAPPVAEPLNPLLAEHIHGGPPAPPVASEPTAPPALPAPVGAATAGPPAPRTPTWEELIKAAAVTYNVPPNLALALAKIESSLNPDAVNPVTGTRGLFQLSQGTAARRKVDAKDPLQNIIGGVGELRDLLNANGGSLDAALRLYGGSPGTPAPDAYIQKIVAEFARLEAGGATNPVTRPDQKLGTTVSRNKLLGATPPEPGWWEQHPILNEMRQGLDPHEPSGRRNIAGAVGGAVGGTIGAVAGLAEGAVGGLAGGPAAPATVPLGAAAMAAIQAKAGSAIGAGIFGGAEHALLEETGWGPRAAKWAEQNLGLGKVDEVEKLDPNSSAFDRSMQAGGEQAAYDVLGSIIAAPLKGLAKRVIQTPIGRSAAHYLGDARARALAAMGLDLNAAKTAGRTENIAGAEAVAAVREAAESAAQEARREAEAEALRISREGGLSFRQANEEWRAARDLARARKEQTADLSAAAVQGTKDTWKQRAADAVTHGVEALERFRTERVAPLLAEAPFEGRIGKTIADLFKGPAKARERALGQAVEAASRKAKNVDYSAVEEEAARLLREEILPSLKEFPRELGGIPAAPTAAAAAPPPPLPGGTPSPGSRAGRAVAAGQQNIFAPPPVPPVPGTTMSPALQELIGDIGQPAYEALLAEPGAQTLMRILNRAPGEGSHFAGHRWKRELMDAVSGTLDKTKRSMVQNRQLHLGRLIREALGVDEGYNRATAAYEAVAPTFTEGMARVIRRNAKSAPHKIVQALSMDDPAGAKAIVDILTTHAEAGAREGFVQTARETAEKAARAAKKGPAAIKRAGDVAARKATKEGADVAAASVRRQGEEALGEVQKQWVFRNLSEGGIEGLKDRLAKVRARPEFEEAFFSTGPGKDALKNLDELVAAYEAAVAQAKNAPKQVAAAGEKAVRVTEAEAKTLKAQVKGEGRADVERARQKTADLMLDKKTKLEDARVAAAAKQDAITHGKRIAQKGARKANVEGRRELAEKIQAKRAAIAARKLPQPDEVAFARSSLGGSMRSGTQTMADLINAVKLRGGYHGAVGLLRLAQGSRSADLAQYVAFSNSKLLRVFTKGLLSPKLPALTTGLGAKVVGGPAGLKPAEAVKELYLTITGTPPPKPPNRQEKR